MTCESWAALRESARRSSEPSENLIAHLRSCSHCGLSYERERALTVQLWALRERANGPRSSGDRRAGLLREFDSMQRPRRNAIWTVAIAAMLLVGVALVGRWQVRPQSGSTADFAEAEGYTAVPYTTPLAPGEFVRVLHADLPLSGLVQMGLDVEEEPADTIPVDLMVGEDGLPRAVRVSSDEF